MPERKTGVEKNKFVILRLSGLEGPPVPRELEGYQEWSECSLFSFEIALLTSSTTTGMDRTWARQSELRTSPIRFRVSFGSAAVALMKRLVEDLPLNADFVIMASDYYGGAKELMRFELESAHIANVAQSWDQDRGADTQDVEIDRWVTLTCRNATGEVFEIPPH